MDIKDDVLDPSIHLHIHESSHNYIASMDGDIDSKAFGYYPLNFLGREFCFNLTSKHLVDFRNGKNKLTHLNKQWDNNVAVFFAYSYCKFTVAR